MERPSLFSITAIFLIFCSVTIAANPVNWTFDTETMGEDVSWDSNPSYIDNHYTVYEYHWEITKVEAYVQIIFWIWFDISFLLDELSGDGIHYGSLPATILDERIQEGDVGADIEIIVDEDGYATASVTNITFGVVEGMDIRGIRIEGDITITGSVVKPVRNTNQGTYHMAIQDAIDNANNYDVIIANPITYEENINFSGKNITVTSTNHQDPNLVAQTIIQGSGNIPVVEFQGSETSDCNLVGFTITGGAAEGGIYGDRCGANISYCIIRDNLSEFNGAAISDVDGTIDNCTIIRNTADLSRRGGALADCDGKIENCLITGNHAYTNSAVYNCDADIINCTIADNTSNSGAAIDSCNGKIVNSIIYYNQPAESVANCPDVSFCSLESYKNGAGNIYEDPCFVSLTDYHLMSQAGSWDDVNEIWVYDSATSKCINAGGTSFSLGDEYTHANNIRINMGIYGGTAQASKSPAGWSVIADITNDGIVNFEDFAWMAEYFWHRADGITGDLNRDRIVYFDDLSIMGEKWLQQTTWY